MILVDVNLLVYSVIVEQPQHFAAKAWLDQQLNGSAKVGVPWPSLLGFLRLVTNGRLFSTPLSIDAAWSVVEAWLKCPAVWTPQATNAHSEILRGLLEGSAVRANLVPDAHLAALAIEHGLTLCSTDGDFARFRGLRWSNPLAR